MTIYKYFANRAGLVLAIIDNQLMEVTKSLDELSLLNMQLSEGLNYIDGKGVRTAGARIYYPK